MLYVNSSARLTAPVDGSGSPQIRLNKPDGATVTKEATHTDGVVSYTTVSGDLPSPGLYRYQARLDTGSGFYYSDIYNFQVLSPNG